MVMADMRKLLKVIQTFYDGQFETIRSTLQSSGAKGSDAALEASVQGLRSSSKELQVYLHESEFRKAAMEYTAEKNRYGSMLLALYAILNLSALAMIYKLR